MNDLDLEVRILNLQERIDYHRAMATWASQLGLLRLAHAEHTLVDRLRRELAAL